jgi:hypothetical protein
VSTQAFPQPDFAFRDRKVSARGHAYGRPGHIVAVRDRHMVIRDRGWPTVPTNAGAGRRRGAPRPESSHLPSPQTRRQERVETEPLAAWS